MATSGGLVLVVLNFWRYKMVDENETNVPNPSEEQLEKDADNKPTQTEAVKETVLEEVEQEPKTLAEKVEHAFEALREHLVSLIGDIPGVHNIVNDAKAAIKPHVGQ